MKKKLRIVCIADLQALSLQIKPELLPKGDILLIGGDLAGWGSIRELEECNTWLGTLKQYKHKVIVAGNHDQEIRDIDGHHLFTNATYLQDELVTVEGLKIYGSPANEMNELRLYWDWAFCDPDYLKKVAKEIPEGLDVLLTHGPPYGILDWAMLSDSAVGSKDLLDAVRQKKPKYHVFGHIHESHGIIEKDGTTFINAAICDSNNTMFKKDGSLYYDPIVIEI